MLTRAAGTVSKALGAPGSGGREAWRWGCAIAIVGGLLLGLEGLAPRPGGAPPVPAGMALEVVTLPAPPAPPAPTMRAQHPAPEPARPAARTHAAQSAPDVSTATLTASEPPRTRDRQAQTPEPSPEARREADDAPPAAPASDGGAPARAVAATPPATFAAAATQPAARPESGAATQPAARPAASPAAPARWVPVQALDPGFGLMQPVQPRYPQAARRLRRAGRVEVELEVAPDGRVTALAIREDAAGWGFAAAAREAFADARFTPPRVRGEPVRVRWRKTLLFRP